MSVENSTERQLSKEAQDQIDAWASKHGLSPDSPAVQKVVYLIAQMEQAGATLEHSRLTLEYMGKWGIVFKLRLGAGEPPQQINP